MLHALNKDSGLVLWVSQLNFPMIGSFEYDHNQKEVSDNIFIPLIDGNLIKFDKEGYLEVRELLTRDVEDPVQRQRLGVC
jgi:hypothetical protein